MRGMGEIHKLLYIVNVIGSVIVIVVVVVVVSVVIIINVNVTVTVAVPFHRFVLVLVLPFAVAVALAHINIIEIDSSALLSIPSRTWPSQKKEDKLKSVLFLSA